MSVPNHSEADPDVIRGVEEFVSNLLSDSVTAHCSSNNNNMNTSPVEFNDVAYLRVRASSLVRKVFNESLDFMEMEQQRNMSPEEVVIHHAGVAQARELINAAEQSQNISGKLLMFI